jgi:hypothetical protein
MTFFKHKEIELYLEKLKKIISLVFDRVLLEKLLDKFSTNASIYSSPSIFQLFESHLKSIREQIGEPPQVGWSMPGEIEGYPIINEFLHSDDEDFTYKGFPNIRVSIRKFSISIAVREFSPKSFNAYIRKSKEYFEFEDQKFKKNMSEYIKFKKFINDNKK